MREGRRGAGGGEGAERGRVLREVTQGTRKEMKEMRVRGTPGSEVSLCILKRFTILWCRTLLQKSDRNLEKQT